MPDLRQYVEQDMRMQSYYQPVLLAALIRAGGSASLRDLARAAVVEDEEVLVAMEERLRRMPLKVLAQHGIVVVDGDVVRLSEPVPVRMRDRLLAACQRRLTNWRTYGTWAA